MNIEKQETQTCPDQISDPGRRNNSELGGPGKIWRSPLCHPGVYVRSGSTAGQESRGALKMIFFSFSFARPWTVLRRTSQGWPKSNFNSADSEIGFSFADWMSQKAWRVLPLVMTRVRCYCSFQQSTGVKRSSAERRSCKKLDHTFEPCRSSAVTCNQRNAEI